jgi:ribosomal protein S27AE
MENDIIIGKFMKFKHPDYAEHFVRSDYTSFTSKTYYSEALGRDVEKHIEILHCPRCGKKADNKEDHGDAYKCGKCKLNRQCYGNSIYVWND